MTWIERAHIFSSYFFVLIISSNLHRFPWTVDLFYNSTGKTIFIMMVNWCKMNPNHNSIQCNNL